MTEVVSHLPAILRPYYLAEVIVRSAHFLHALGSRPALVITARRWSPSTLSRSSCNRFCNSMTDTHAQSQRERMASCFTNRKWRLYWIVDERGQKVRFQRNQARRDVGDLAQPAIEPRTRVLAHHAQNALGPIEKSLCPPSRDPRAVHAPSQP